MLPVFGFVAYSAFRNFVVTSLSAMVPLEAAGAGHQVLLRVSTPLTPDHQAMLRVVLGAAVVNLLARKSS